MEPGLENTQRALIGPESLPRGSSSQGYTATAVASPPFHVEGLEVERLGMREGGVLVQGVRGTALEGGVCLGNRRKGRGCCHVLNSHFCCGFSDHIFFFFFNL